MYGLNVGVALAHSCMCENFSCFFSQLFTCASLRGWPNEGKSTT